jgi:H+-translocating NAD(P) transhydrogenase subunit alpha
MNIAVPTERTRDERRVALVPETCKKLIKQGLEITVQAGAGQAAGFLDAAYTAAGAKLAPDPQTLYSQADVVLKVQRPILDPAGIHEADLIREGATLIGSLDPLTDTDGVRKLADRRLTAFSLELLPRITRAQTMDVLSSMATIAGYKAVLLAAEALPKMFPLLMTAAGTLAAARVFIVGAGVAGLQAIATARRLGAVVSAYDVRPAVKEQVQSLGGKFVEMELTAGEAEDKGGYAKAMGEEFYRRQRELMTRVVAEHDVVITTAAIPGKPAPRLITADMVKGMAPGSVIVDLAAERGGNCELTQPGRTVVEYGVTILGPLNLPATTPYHASQMYARNITAFLLHLVKDGKLTLDLTDEITRETLVTRDGEVVQPRLRELLGLPPLPAEAAQKGVPA